MSFSYVYSIVSDTAQAKVDSGRLTQEIDAASLSSAALAHINTFDDSLEIVFDQELESGDEVTLTGVVGAHDGRPVVFTGLDFFEKVVSDATTTTTLAKPFTKLTLGPHELSQGTYELLVSYGWNADSTSSDFLAFVHQNGVQLGQTHQQEPKDAGGSFLSTGTNQKLYTTRAFSLDLPAGIYTWTLSFGPEKAGNEASMWDALMRVRKV